MQPAAPAALRDLAAAIAGYWLGTNEVPPAGG
jgi:hypothetical protein